MNLSFRTKLLFCMMIVVVGVTTATIILTQDRVRETYRLLFEEEFTNDLEFAADQQATRLATYPKRRAGVHADVPPKTL